jgi:hypothetical protein
VPRRRSKAYQEPEQGDGLRWEQLQATWQGLDDAQLAERHRLAGLLRDHGYGSLPDGWYR